MDAAADGTTSSSVVATQSTMGPPATRRCPTPPQITEDGAMDVGANSLVVAMQPTTETSANRTFPTPPQTTNEEAMDATANDSAASSVTCAQSGYSLDYVKFCTNIYSVMIKFRLEIHPKAPLTPLIIEKLVKKMYHFHQESFARSELPAGFRKLSANEQMALKTKGPFAWAWEQLHTPIGTERSEAPVISKSKTPVEKATTTDVQEITTANANAIERSRAGEQVQTPIGTERMESPVISKSKTPVEKATTPDVQEIATANANERSRAGEQVQTPIGTERSELPVISNSKTPVEKATTPDVQEIATANAIERSRAGEQVQTPIGTERSESPVISNSKTPVEKATAPDVQEITTANENERSRKTQPGRTVMQAKRQKKNCIFPGVRSTRPQNIVYESDTPPVTEPVFVGVDYNAAASQNQHIATNVDPLYEPDSTSFRPIVSSTHSQDGSIQPGQSDAPEKNVPSVSEPAIQNQQNTPTVDTLSEPDSLTFRPFVSSTQSQDGSSQPGQPDAPEENVPPVSEPNQNQQNTPTVDTLSEPDSLTFRPFVSSTQQQDTNSQQEQPVPMGEKTPQALATTSSTPRAIPADDAANDSSCVIIKGERISQKLDTSGYAGYVEEIPCSPQIYTIVDSDDDYQEEFEAHRTDAVQHSLFNRLSLEQQMVLFTEGWKSVVGSHRKRQRRPVKDLCFTLAKVPGKSTVHPSLPFDFLIDTDIESVRYTQRPIRWRGCNELQENKLTVNLHHRTAGIFTVSVRDQQVGHLLGLLGPAQTSSAGWEALKASLAHVGKFRYGRNEPSAEYYRMSVVEKVLHLYFDTLPRFPRDGGFVLWLNQDRSTFPADGGTVKLERFNVHLHSKQRSKSVRKDSITTRQTEDDEEGLENFLMPGVADAMTKMRKCIFPDEQS
uniref:Uncharacterized protein n=1 Tax=Anopheles atroparvus TaxID=41427 RepID=A0A182J5D8_ANOAO